MKRKQSGYTLIELLMVLWFFIVAGVGLTVIGVVIWAILKLVTHFT